MSFRQVVVMFNGEGYVLCWDTYWKDDYVRVHRKVKVRQAVCLFCGLVFLRSDHVADAVANGVADVRKRECREELYTGT